MSDTEKIYDQEIEQTEQADARSFFVDINERVMDKIFTRIAPYFVPLMIIYFIYIAYNVTTVLMI